MALNPENGKELWRYEVPAAPGGGLSRRGVTYWPGERNVPPRLFFTAGRRLLAVNAVTGEAAQGFGANGEVDLAVPYNSPPTIYKNLVFVGANVSEQPATGPPGNTRRSVGRGRIPGRCES